MSLFDTTGGRGIKFSNQGDTITGTITKPPFEKQQTVFGTDKPATYDNGDPKMQILVALSTPLREDANDDGDRTLYVASKKMKDAIADAMRNAGASDIEVGGTLSVTFTGFDPASKNPQNPAKLYAATYTKPSSAFGQQPVAQPAPVQQQPVQQAPQQAVYQPPVQQPQQVPGQTAFPQQQPVQQAPAQPGGWAAGPVAGQQPTPEIVDKVKQLNTLGLDVAAITAALGVPAEQVTGILAF
jgi:hypothetical protein